MSAYKRITNSDVIINPYVANKKWDCDCNGLSENGIKIYFGTKLTGSFSKDSDPINYGKYERLVFDSINHLFYQEFSGSFLDDTLNLRSNNYANASIYRASGSYYNYGREGYIVKNFPSEVNSKITVISIPKDVYGFAVDPSTFAVSMSNINIVDDGNQNLYNVSGGLQEHIGNIFYEHGMAIITNQLYQDVFPKPPAAKDDIVVFLTSYSPKTINVIVNDVSGSCPIVASTVELSGSNASFYTNNLDGTITLNTTDPGNYNIQYTVNSLCDSGCLLTSNYGNVFVDVVSPTTTTTTTTSTTTSTTTVLDCNLAGTAEVTVVPTTTTTTTTTTSTTTTTTTITPTTTSTTTSTTTIGLIDNCITPLLNNETMGVQTFVRLTSAYALTSTLNVYATVNTQYDSYGPSLHVCNIGSTSTNHKYLYTSGFIDESATSVVINSISPESDSTYNYIDCTPFI
jgi:hypothetical protein